MDFATVVRELATVKAELRLADDDLKSDRLRVELDLLAKFDSKTIGPNESDRKRAYDASCLADSDYKATLAVVRRLQARRDELEAERDILAYQYNERDLLVRERS